MGIFPRNDNMALMPIIDRINRNLAKLADGQKVRYLNINDKLAVERWEIDRRHDEREGQTSSELAGVSGLGGRFKTAADGVAGAPAAADHAPPATGDPSPKH